MTQEEKQLLLKDLCGRLPYGVILDNGVKLRRIDALVKIISGSGSDRELEHVRPYLRPMSSMTEEEWDEYYHYGTVGTLNLKNEACGIDWLNEHHFDYRGLISMGLALEAPEGMYKTD